MLWNTYLDGKHIFQFGSQLWHQLLDDLCPLIDLEVAKFMEKVGLDGLRSPLFEFATE
jgi:hypothetical protein